MSDLPFLRPHASGASLQIKAVPRASRTEIGEILGDRLKIRIAAPPVDSAANDELIAFLAKKLGVPRQSVEITRGRTTRNKTVFVGELEPGAVAERLGNLH